MRYATCNVSQYITVPFFWVIGRQFWKYVAEQCLRRNLLTPQYFNITVHLVLFATSTSVIEPKKINSGKLP